ncbi:MAG: MFS transporter [Propionicimonas sp.]
MTSSATQPAAEATYKPFRWFILATLIVVVAVQAMALISPAPLIGEMMATMPDLSAGQITWMTMGTWNLFVALAAIGGGVLLDRFGFIPLYIAGISLIMIGWLLMPVWGDSFWGMTALRTIQAIGGGPIMGAGVYVAATCFPSRERSIATGALGFAMSVGIAAGLSLSPANFAATGNWQQALFNLWPFGVVAIVMSLVVAFGPKVAPEQAAPATDQAPVSNAALFKKALLTPVTWAAIGCVVLASWFNQAFNDMTPGYLALDAPVGLGLGPAGSNLLAVAQFGQMIGAVVIGIIVERLFRGNVRPPVMIGFSMLALGSLALLTPAINANQGPLTASLLVTLFFFAWINPAALGYIAKHYPAEITGKLGGLAQGVGIFGGLAGVAAGSAALHATGFYTVSTWIMFAACIGGLVVSLFLKARKPAELSEKLPVA